VLHGDLPANGHRYGMDPETPTGKIFDEYEQRISRPVKPVIIKSGPCKRTRCLGMMLISTGSLFPRCMRAMVAGISGLGIASLPKILIRAGPTEGCTVSWFSTAE